MRIRKSDFKKLRPIAYKTHTKVHIVNKRGFFDLRRRYKKRYGLIAGAFLCAVFLIVAPRFIWTVEITGNEDVETEAVEHTLRNLGIYRGALKSRIPDGFTVKHRLLKENKGLTWAWVYINGTAADVHVYEKTLPPSVVEIDKPCDIVSACDAYVESVRVLYGEGKVKGASVVQAGETIVSGKVSAYREGDPENYLYVHAQAEIRAYTERTKSGVYALEYEHRIPTGRSQRRIYLDLFGKRINLYRDEECEYESYDREEFFHDFMGIAIGGIRYSEAYVEYEPMSIDGAIQLAKEDLEEKIAAQLCKNAELVGEDLQYERISDKEIKVKLTMSFIEDIGVEVPCEAVEENMEEIAN